MTNRTCEQIEEVLVDYADNELGGQERQRVEAHLETCPDCRQLLEALQRSAVLAGEAWDEAYGGLLHLGVADVVRRRRRWVRAGGAVAAAVVLAALGSLAWRGLVVPGPRQVARPGGTGRPKPSVVAAAGPTAAQVRRAVEEAGATTALLASVDWLAEEPGNREIARQQYEFITHMYAGSEVARQAQTRLAALDQRRS